MQVTAVGEAVEYLGPDRTVDFLQARQKRRLDPLFPRSGYHRQSPA